MGQVAQVGPDAYNARRCAVAAGVPTRATAMNVNRLCSSGLQAIVTGAQEILTGQAAVVVAGGDESMTRQPFLDYHARDGFRLGPREVLDGTMSLVTDPFGALSDGSDGGAGGGALRRLPRGAGRVCGAQPGACGRGDRGGALRARDRPDRAAREPPSRRPRRASRPGTTPEALGEAEARLQGRGDGDCGQLRRDQRRRSGGRVDARLGGGAPRPHAAAAPALLGRVAGSSRRSWATPRPSRSRRRSSARGFSSRTSTSSS